LLACAGVANAAKLDLSTHSSDDTPAEALLATFEFTVTGGAALGGQTLSLTVTNNTVAISEGGLGAFALSEIFFNSAAGVDLNLTPITAGLNGWTLDKTGAAHAGGFGSFDFALLADKQGGSPGAIAAGSSLTFGFDIDGDTVTADDFTTELSTIPPGGRPAYAAAKFIQGPGDDSGYGAYIPLPPALPMGIAGLLGVAVLGRRKRAKIINPG
jgi:hypothetical protein